jgi:hypothetical protein
MQRHLPITMAAHGLSFPAIMLASWPPIIQYIYSLGILVCIRRGLATGRSSVQEVLSTVYRIKKQKRRPISAKSYKDNINNGSSNIIIITVSWIMIGYWIYLLSSLLHSLTVTHNKWQRVFHNFIWHHQDLRCTWFSPFGSTLLSSLRILLSGPEAFVSTFFWTCFK